MRIGIYLQQGLASSGGSYTILNAILQGLQSINSEHEIWLLPHLQDKAIHLKDLKHYTLKDGSKHLNSPLIEYILNSKLYKYFLKFTLKIRSFLNIKSREQIILKKIINKFNLELIWYPNPGSSNINFDIPFFITLWDLEHRKQPFFPEVSETGLTWNAREHHFSKILTRASIVFTGTEEGKKEAIHFYRLNSERVKVNFFPAPKKSVKISKDYTESVLNKFSLNRNFLLYPAQFWPHKNHVNLLRAIKLLEVNHNIIIDLVFTGSDKGNLNFIKENVVKLGITEKIHFLGFVSVEELEVLYCTAQALIYPSFFGPDNLPPLEAFASSCAVIMADIPGAKEHFSEAALFFDPLSPVDIAIKTALLFTDQALKNYIIKNGLKIVEKRSPIEYVKNVIEEVDRFESIRRNWNNDYKHL